MPGKETVRIEDFKGLRVAYLRDQGPTQYAAPSLKGKMRAVALQQKLHSPYTLYVSIVNDNPHANESGHVRVDAAVGVAADFQPAKESGLELREIPAGAYAVYRHVGSYKTLRDAWANFASLLHTQTDYRSRGPCTTGPRDPGDPGPDEAPSFEIYRNDPAHTPEDQLITDLYQPIKAAR